LLIKVHTSIIYYRSLRFLGFRTGTWACRNTGAWICRTTGAWVCRRQENVYARVPLFTYGTVYFSIIMGKDLAWILKSHKLFYANLAP